jgi:hypothetical protein
MASWRGWPRVRISAELTVCRHTRCIDRDDSAARDFVNLNSNAGWLTG